jgi:hypothetical protein
VGYDPPLALTEPHPAAAKVFEQAAEWIRDANREFARQMAATCWGEAEKPSSGAAMRTMHAMELKRLYGEDVADRFWGEGVADQLANLPPAEPKPPPTLSDFTASVETHLAPRLPGRLRCVSDSCGRGPTAVAQRFVLWVTDEHGRDVVPPSEHYGPIDETDGAEMAGEIASALMSRQARQR